MKKTFHIITVIVLGLLVCIHPTQSAEPDHSMAVVTQEVKRQLALIATLVPQESAQTPIRIHVNSHPDSAWVYALAEDAVAQRGAVLTSKDNAPRLDLTVLDIRTTYSPTEHADSVDRSIVVWLSGTYSATGKRESPEKVVITTRCSRADAMRTQSLQLQATHGTLPPEQRSILEELVEPVVFVAAAVVTVVLAFTVRSK